MEFSSFFELGDGWSFGSILVKVNQSSKYLAWRGASKKVEKPRPHIICVIAANNVTFSLKYHCPIAPAILNNCLMLNQHLARQEQNANYVTSILVFENFNNLETLPSGLHVINQSYVFENVTFLALICWGLKINKQANCLQSGMAWKNRQF